jgi:hypothetical protein
MDMTQRILSKIDEEVFEMEKTISNRSGGEFGFNLESITGKFQRGSELQTKKKFERPDTSSPDAFFDILSKVFSKNSFLIILDELDVVRSEEFLGLFADLLKILSNHSDSCRVTILSIGIQSHATNLLAAHRSLERCARELYLEPIKGTDLHQFRA